MPNATKVWLTRTGQCVIANNDSRIPQSDLNELLDIVSAQLFMICRKWKEHFCVEEIQFFCWISSEFMKRNGTGMCRFASLFYGGVEICMSS